MPKQTIYLNFGVLDEQAECEVTLEHQEAWTADKEAGRATSEECPAGYVVTGIRCTSIKFAPWEVFLKFTESEHFARAVYAALRDEGIEI